jgi:hypothetical protein
MYMDCKFCCRSSTQCMLLFCMTAVMSPHRGWVTQLVGKQKELHIQIGRVLLFSASSAEA